MSESKSSQVCASRNRPAPLGAGRQTFGNRRLHKILGPVEAGLAACIEFLAIPILSILIFAVLMIVEGIIGDVRCIDPASVMSSRRADHPRNWPQESTEET